MIDPVAEAYDKVVYPSVIFSQTHPDRLAAIAALHGLEAPPLATARILEIGGGDGLNLLAMAHGWPDARFLSFDFSREATARGKAMLASSGLRNIRIELGDILDAARDLSAEFDYVIAHGVYSWVPHHVREALMIIIGRVLSPHGIAFVSYNAMPGGGLRATIRSMLLHATAGIIDPEARVAAARAFLADYAVSRPNDRPIVAGMRTVAAPMVRKLPSSIFHDELADNFHPQALVDVVAAAQQNGLAFLNDASPQMMADGLPEEDWEDARVVAEAQASDNQAMCFFHETLLVRASRSIKRSPDLDRVRQLYATGVARRLGTERFETRGDEFVVRDPVLADVLESLSKAHPRRILIGDFDLADEAIVALLKLYAVDAVELYANPARGAISAGPYPATSPFALAILRAGNEHVYTLDHRTMILDQPGPRAFLALLDGTRDRAALAQDWAASAYGHEVDVDTALANFAEACLLIQ
jgi:SAM-dependent methyltransferase